MSNVHDFEDICKNMFSPNFTLLIVNAWLINYTGMQDFRGLEVCNGFGRFGGRWVQKSHPFLSNWSGLAVRRHTFCSFSQNIEKPHQKFQKLSPTIFNLKTDFVISNCAFQCRNALSAVVEPCGPTGSELEVAFISGNYNKILCQNSLCLVP